MDQWSVLLSNNYKEYLRLKHPDEDHNETTISNIFIYLGEEVKNFILAER